jgi:hypothetical protein
MTFVTLGGEASYMARRHPRAPNIVVSRKKVCESPLHLYKERSKSLVEWGKRLKEIRLGVGESPLMPHRGE